MDRPELTGAVSQNLAVLLERGANADELAWQIFALTVEQVRVSDPALAELLPRAAIPRRLDPMVIGALRDAPDDTVENARLMTALLSFSFVLGRRDGGFCYHDTTRDMLLKDWRFGSSTRRAEFDELNRRLAAFYERRHDSIRRIDGDLTEVAGVIQRASRERYAQLVSTIRDRVEVPLLEALYHETLGSAEAGLTFFERHFGEYEQRGWLRTCTALVHAARNNFKQLWPQSEQEPWAKWLRYYRARLAHGARQYEEAERRLRDLLPQTETPSTDDEIKLRLWVLGELGNALFSQFKLQEARTYYELELELAETAHDDIRNLPLSYGRLAGLHEQLDELSAADSRYQQALEMSRETADGEMETWARVQLSNVCQRRGDGAEALEHALEALHYVRTRHEHTPQLRQALAGQFMALFARRDPCLLRTTFLGAGSMLEALLADMGSPLVGLEHRKLYTELLLDSGQHTRAEEHLDGLDERAKAYAETTFGTELLFAWALLRTNQGRLDESIALYDQVIRRAEAGLGTVWNYAAARSNRGMSYANRGDWQAAEADLQAALGHWQTMGHDVHAAVIRVFLAGTARRQGRLPDAQNLLDEARDQLRDARASYRADFHFEQAEVLRAQGRWSEAREHYERAADHSRAIDAHEAAARALSGLAAVAGHQGDWESAERYTAEAATFWRRLAQLESFRPSEEIQMADEQNAEGIRHLTTARGNRRDDLVRARELFNSALRARPDNASYRWNLAFTYAALGEWEEAARTVETLLERAPDWLHARFLYARLDEYRGQRRVSAHEADT